MRNRPPNFETSLQSNFGKTGDFKTGPCNLAGSGFETGVAEWALSLAGLVATPSSCCMTSIFHWATFHPTFVSSTASNFLKKHEFHGLTLCLSTLCQYGFLISLSI